MFDSQSRSVRSPLDSANEWDLTIGFAALIGATYVLGVVLGLLTRGDAALLSVVREPIFFPVLFVFAPAILAAVNVLRGGSLTSGIVIGLVPGVLFPILSVVSSLLGITGLWYLPVWVLSLYYGAIGFFSALFGIVVATGLKRISSGET